MTQYLLQTKDIAPISKIGNGKRVPEGMWRTTDAHDACPFSIAFDPGLKPVLAHGPAIRG